MPRYHNPRDFHSFEFVISFPTLCATATVEPHLKKSWPALPHSDSKADGFADQLQHCAKSEGSDHPLQSANEAAELGYSALGASPLLEQRCQKGFVNARAEKIGAAPAFRRPFQKHRCLIPADGFYEWQKTPEGKVPYSIEMKDGSPFVFAGLWDGWQNPDTKEWLRTCVIITGEPNELVAQIHTRMPVILPPETHERWLAGESEKKSCDRSLPKKWPQEESPNGSINQKITIPACSIKMRWSKLDG
jgi:putative SOS response-associated peptidase YedK